MNFPRVCKRCGFDHHTRTRHAHTLEPCVECQDVVETPEEIAMRTAVTTVPCPACSDCTGCDGEHRVTAERAKELRAGITAQGGPRR